MTSTAVPLLHPAWNILNDLERVFLCGQRGQTLDLNQKRRLAIEDLEIFLLWRIRGTRIINVDYLLETDELQSGFHIGHKSFARLCENTVEKPHPLPLSLNVLVQSGYLFIGLSLCFKLCSLAVHDWRMLIVLPLDPARAFMIREQACTDFRKDALEQVLDCCFLVPELRKDQYQPSSVALWPDDCGNGISRTCRG